MCPGRCPEGACAGSTSEKAQEGGTPHPQDGETCTEPTDTAKDLCQRAEIINRIASDTLYIQYGVT